MKTNPARRKQLCGKSKCTVPPAEAGADPNSKAPTAIITAAPTRIILIPCPQNIETRRAGLKAPTNPSRPIRPGQAPYGWAVRRSINPLNGVSRARVGAGGSVEPAGRLHTVSVLKITRRHAQARHVMIVVTGDCPNGDHRCTPRESSRVKRQRALLGRGTWVRASMRGRNKPRYAADWPSLTPPGMRARLDPRRGSVPMSWNLSGNYVETCSCELMCPCNLSLDHGATYDYCRVTLAFDVR